MLLFQKRFHGGLQSGEITLTFRRWEKARVRPGGRYRCHPIGVLEVHGIARVRVEQISEADAKSAGFETRQELVDYMRGARDEVLEETTEVFRIDLRHGGDGDRVEIALETDLTDEDIETIRKKLARMDAKEPWTKKTMALIDKAPRTAASKLAAKLGRETLPFKEDVRKLKKLGLTQSFEVGYELSPRGRAYLLARATSTSKARGTRAGRAKA